MSSPDHIAPLFPGRDVSGDGSEEGSLEGPLRRQIAAAHEKLEARLLSAIEAQHACLLKALAGLVDVRFMRGVESNDGSPFGGESSMGYQAFMSRASAHSMNSDEPGSSRGLQDALDSQEEEQEDEEEESNLERRVSGGLPGISQTLQKQKSQLFLDGSRSSQIIPTSSRSQAMQRTLSCVVGLKDRKEFETFITFVILANALSIGLSADHSMKNPGDAIPTYFRVLDYSFMSIFAMELCLRILAEGSKFCMPWNPSFGWNVFDSILIVASVVNEGTFGLNLSVVRVFRLLRLVTVMRMIRLMRPFRELRMMVSGIMNCGKTLLWSILLLSIISYIYAVFCLQIAAEWLATANDGATQGAQLVATKAFLQRHFPSVLWSVYTLFKGVSGGINWGEIADPFDGISVFLLASFPLYIVVTVFCVLNIITAAFVEAAHRTTQEEDTKALEDIEEREIFITKIEELFKKHDVDHNGSLEREEFMSVMSDWRTQEYFNRIGLAFDFQRAENIFRLFDWDGDGTIDINEFAQGVHHLRGTARSLDMFREFQLLNRKLDKGMRKVEKTAHRHSTKFQRSPNFLPFLSRGSISPKRHVSELKERFAPTAKLADDVVC